MKPRHDGHSLPIVSLSSDPATAEEVFRAASTCGFMYLRGSGTGISTEMVGRMFELVSPFLWRYRVRVISLSEKYLHSVY